MTKSMLRIIGLATTGLALAAALTGCNSYPSYNVHPGWGGPNGWGYNGWQQNTVVVDSYRQNDVFIDNNRWRREDVGYYHPGRNWR